MNNRALKKIMIILRMNAESLIEAADLAGVNLSSSEARAWLVGQRHKNYRRLSDDDFLLLLDCLIKKYREGVEE